MTPTLAGRRHTRIFLALTVGLPVCLGYGLLVGDRLTPLALLTGITAMGLAWDRVYQTLQARRWDRDWPPILQLGAGVWEGALLWLLIVWWRSAMPLGSVSPPGVNPSLTLGLFAAHYGTVWLAMFIVVQGPMRIVAPTWRHRGGRLI